MISIEKELNFNNIKVIYNGSEINKRSIFKNNFIMYSGAVLTIITICVLLLAVPEPIISTIYGIVLSLVGSIGILIGSAGLVCFILNNYSPVHFDFVAYMMKFKSNQLEFGLFNGEYMAKVLGQNGCRCLNLERFIGEDYILLEDDKVDKSKPLYVTINCMQDKITLLIENLNV